MRQLQQPSGSRLCGQTCVAMAADVSLDRAIEVFGHSKGTYTREVAKALRSLGIPCGDRLKRIARAKPVLPKRGVIHIRRTRIEGKRRGGSHWMLIWDGEIHDPERCWPDGYDGWEITSYLEIYS